MKRLLKNIFRSKSTKNREIDPDEIFIDSQNLPQFDTNQFEGRLDTPISQTSLVIVGVLFSIVLVVFLGQSFSLQVKKGEAYLIKSENNRLNHSPLFAPRGILYDRNDKELAWNVPTDDPNVLLRKYADQTGLAHVLGYIRYPLKDSAGFYYSDFEGEAGAEKYFDKRLKGTDGVKIIEVDARGRVQSENTVKPAVEGDGIKLSIDAAVQHQLHESIRDIAVRVGFVGGSGVIMDVRTGEVIALTSYPEYNPDIISRRQDATKIKEYFSSKSTPFLDRAVDGLYTPGSIMKPFVALAALNEGVINEHKQILSTGSISIPNPYDSKKESVFRDWKAHGWVNVREALAVSSDVYFYAVGGGYKNQKGLGIAQIDKYSKMFGFGVPIQNSYFSGPAGVIPTPEWKKEKFNGEAWFLGNTYHTAIGQYGYQVSPIQMVRGLAGIANKGTMVEPTIIRGQQGTTTIVTGIKPYYYDVVQEGMRMSAETGTSKALNVSYVKIAGKSGTAELGVSKDNVNSWITGFWPYENPKYVFAVVMEKGSKNNLVGAAAAMRELLDWMATSTPEYFK